MTHTPGPWYVTGSSSGGTIHAKNHRLIVPHSSAVFNEPEDWDNRRLIAAAPDLLAALQTIQSCSDNEMCPDCADGARAAIAKTEGGAS